MLPVAYFLSVLSWEKQEPLMIPHGARSSGMAYWQEREASEKGRRRRRKPAAGTRTAGGTEDSTTGRTSWDGSSSEGLLEGGNGLWEDEKEEVRERRGTDLFSVSAGCAQLLSSCRRVVKTRCLGRYNTW